MRSFNYIQVTDPAEIAAVKAGQIRGTTNPDDEADTWALSQSLHEWRASQFIFAQRAAGKLSAPPKT